MAKRNKKNEDGKKSSKRGARSSSARQVKARPIPARESAHNADEISTEALRQIERAFVTERPELLSPARFQAVNPRLPDQKFELDFTGDEAFLPPARVLPDDMVDLGGLPVKITREGPVIPNLDAIRYWVTLLPWDQRIWRIWTDIIRVLTPCEMVPAKTGYVEIDTAFRTNMCHMSNDCARIYTVSDNGIGCVINVITEIVEDFFTVTPNPSPSPPHPPGITPLVHPFTKGGINHKYQRLYVPASFYSPTRSPDYGGYYIAVVDINPVSPTYLQTVSWIDCGWIPEEVSFSEDNEIGVIANYMQGTATFFRASNGQIIGAKERDGFDGAGAIEGGGAFARSVRCGNIPGVGNRAFMTLTENTSNAGLAVFDLDSNPAFNRTNFPISGFIDGVAFTPDNRRLLVLSTDELTVLRVDVEPAVVERTITLPKTSGQTYMAGLAVRPTGDLVFLATGNHNVDTATQGTSLTQVNWATGSTLEVPGGIASQTWGLEIKSFGNPLKPHIIVCSRSGKLTMIPC